MHHIPSGVYLEFSGSFPTFVEIREDGHILTDTRPIRSEITDEVMNDLIHVPCEFRLGSYMVDKTEHLLLNVCVDRLCNVPKVESEYAPFLFRPTHACQLFVSSHIKGDGLQWDPQQDIEERRLQYVSNWKK